MTMYEIQWEVNLLLSANIFICSLDLLHICLFYLVPNPLGPTWIPIQLKILELHCTDPSGHSLLLAHLLLAVVQKSGIN